MNILVTGNNGYIGPVLYREIKKKIPNSKVFGFDNNYFRIKNFSDKQYSGDIRNFLKLFLTKKLILLFI